MTEPAVVLERVSVTYADATSPALVGAYSIIEGVIPPRRLATTMVVLATCTAVGVSAGASGAGVLIDLRGPGAALLLPLLAGALVLIGAAGLREPARRAGQSGRTEATSAR